MSPVRKKLRERGKYFCNSNEAESLSNHETSAMEDIRKEALFNENFLDVGCGKGNLVFKLGKIGKISVGIDISKRKINYAVKNVKDTNSHFILADATRLPFRDNSFKVITAIDVIEHLSDYEEFISECKRILKTNGLMYIHTPNRLQTNLRKMLTRWKGWCEEHVHEFSPSELMELLKTRGFRDVKIFRLDGLWMLRFFPPVINRTFSKILNKFSFMYDGFHLKVKK
jgi:ubiquinone/menaquinone biosynthesis C-methylase UbiE